MPPALTTIFLVTFVSVHVKGNGNLVGKQATLSDIGLSAGITAMHMVGLQNMDSSKSEEEASDEDGGSGGSTFGETLVVNGNPAYAEMFQFQAGLILNTSLGYFQICGAILLSKRRALTAAHCTLYFTGNITFDHFLGVGIHNRSMGLLNPGAQRVRITRAENHRKWTGDHDSGYPFDISILHLEEDIVTNKYVQFAQLANADDGNFEGYMCVVSGWGYTENGRPDILQFGYQHIPSERDCQNFYEIAGGKKLITKKQICGHYYPTSGCSGDSGGPLTCGQKVAGIVSWGLTSCSGCFPNVYTRVSSYADWIDKRL